MREHAIWLPRRLLDPRDRISEVLFGLIMALTITNSLGIAQHGEGDIRALLAGALGCNIAWGLIDAAMYLMTELSDRGRAVLTLRRLRNATEAGAARQIIADALPPVLASVLRQADLDTIRQRLSTLPALPDKPALTADDWIAAVGVFVLVFLSTLPVVFPFVFIGEAKLALRISNGIAIAMLFLCGYALGRYSGQHPWVLGSAMVVVGVALTGVAILLGG